MLNHNLHHPQLLAEFSDLCDFKASDTVTHTHTPVNPSNAILNNFCRQSLKSKTAAVRSPFFSILKPKKCWTFGVFSLHWFADRAGKFGRIHHKSSLHLRNMAHKNTCVYHPIKYWLLLPHYIGQSCVQFFCVFFQVGVVSKLISERLSCNICFLTQECSNLLHAQNICSHNSLQTPLLQIYVD